MYSDRWIDSAIQLVKEFSESKRYFFADLIPSMLNDKLQGVYAIFDKREGTALYVGRTKNMRRRLYTNHLMGPLTNARLKKYLIEDTSNNISNLTEAKAFIRENCYFQFLVENDIVRRGQAEGLLSYALNVKYMHEEH